MDRQRFSAKREWKWPFAALLLGGCGWQESSPPVGSIEPPRILAVASKARPLVLRDESAVAAAGTESPARPPARRTDLYQPLAEINGPPAAPAAPARHKPAQPRDLFDALADLEAASGPLAEPALLPEDEPAERPLSEDSRVNELRIVGPKFELPDPPSPPQSPSTATRKQTEAKMATPPAQSAATPKSPEPLASAPTGKLQPTSPAPAARSLVGPVLNPSVSPNRMPPAETASEPPTASPELSLAPFDSVEPTPELGNQDQPEESQPLVLAPQDATWAGRNDHNPEMDAVLTQATDHVRRAFDLAKRRAIFSARAECLAALRLICQAYDAGEQTDRHSNALAAGLVALEESQDFIARPTDFSRVIDLNYVIAGHRTAVLKGDRTEISSLVAAQRYYTFAQEQLTLAAGDGPVGSAALYALGRLTPDLVDARADRLVPMAQSMVYYQAALTCDSRNYRAANELGVLLAKGGRLEAARGLFERSITLAPQGVAWHNLAMVNKKLGDDSRASIALANAAKLGVNARPDRPAVKWVDPGTFAQSTPPSEGLVNPPSTAEPASRAAKEQPSAVKNKPLPTKPSNTAWLPWNKSSTK